MQIKIKAINIELELVNKAEVDAEHATQLIFVNGQWQVNGPLYPRFMALMNSISEFNKDYKK